MTVNNAVLPASDVMAKRPLDAARAGLNSACAAKAEQVAKIRELGEALAGCGIATLDQQAAILGLPRSTTWTILKSNHKSSGLSAPVISRMLSAPRLPPSVRAKVLEYILDKAAGRYGHNKTLRRKFVARISAKRVDRGQIEAILKGQPQAKINTTTLAPHLEELTLILERHRR